MVSGLVVVVVVVAVVVVVVVVLDVCPFCCLLAPFQLPFFANSFPVAAF